MKELPRVFKMTCSEITTIISRLQATPDSSVDEPEAPTMNAVDNGVVSNMDLFEVVNDLVDNDFDFSTGDDSATSVDEPRDEMFIDNLVSSEESDLTDVSSYDEQDPDCRLFLIMIT